MTGRNGRIEQRDGVVEVNGNVTVSTVREFVIAGVFFFIITGAQWLCARSEQLQDHGSISAEERLCVESQKPGVSC